MPAYPCRFVVAIAMALAAASCSSSPARPPARVVTLLGGSAAADLATGVTPADAVQAWRIDGMTAMKGPVPEDALHDFAVLAGPVAVDATSRAMLADVLSSDDTYLWDIAKACEFSPGVAIRWSGGGHEVDVLICFSCDEIGVWADGTQAGYEDIDPRRADLVNVVKRLFPGDKDIQGLHE